MKKIIAFSGSNSSKSINQKLVIYVSGLISSHEVSVIDLRNFVMPLYSIDIEESEGIPESVFRLKALFDEHDGFIIALPEHNTSLTAVFKNTIDWVSRIHMSFFAHKPIALLSTSPGPGGGKNALDHGAKVLSGYMSGNVVGTAFVPKFHQNTETGINGSIKIVDSEIGENINELVTKLETSLMESKHSLRV